MNTYKRILLVNDQVVCNIGWRKTLYMTDMMKCWCLLQYYLVDDKALFVRVFKITGKGPNVKMPIYAPLVSTVYYNSWGEGVGWGQSEQMEMNVHQHSIRNPITYSHTQPHFTKLNLFACNLVTSAAFMHTKDNNHEMWKLTSHNNMCVE